MHVTVTSTGPDNSHDGSEGRLLATMQGPPRRVTLLLDTGAMHCFICARLAAALDLPPSGQPGPVSVLTAAPGGGQALAAPVLVHLCLGDTFREVLSVSPMDMDVGDDLILGWDWISSHDLRNFYVAGHVSLRSGPARLQLDLLPAAARPTARAMSVLSRGAPPNRAEASRGRGGGTCTASARPRFARESPLDGVVPAGRRGPR